MNLKASDRPPVQRYGVALALSVGALGTKVVLGSTLGYETPFLAVFTAVLLSAWFGGLGPGLVTTGVSALGIAYFFLSPVNSLRVESLRTLVQLAVFLAEGTAISLIVAALENQRRNLGEMRLKAEVLRDVSRQIGDKARLRADRQEALVDLYRRGIAQGPIPLEGTGRLATLLGVDRLAILEVTADGRSLRAVVGDSPEVALDSQAGEARAFASGGSVVFDEAGVGSGAAVAIPGPGGRAVGVVLASSAARRSFPKDDMDFLRGTARILGDVMGLVGSGCREA